MRPISDRSKGWQRPVSIPKSTRGRGGSFGAKEREPTTGS